MTTLLYRTCMNHVLVLLLHIIGIIMASCYMFQMAEFIVENPSDVPVLMQILPLSLYPSPQTIVDMVTPK